MGFIGEVIILIAIGIAAEAFKVWLAAKIVVRELRQEIFYNNEEAEQWTSKDQHRAEWEQWKAQREYEEFEQWKRQKEESAKT